MIEPLPQGPYGAVLMDPPWHFKTYSGKKAVASRTAVDPYPTMTLDELKAIPLIDVLHTDCCVFMWVVDSHLDQAMELGRALGLTYKTIAFIWDKGRMGMGKWTRKEGEICLLFTRGKPKRLSGGVRQIIREPRREHSRKPASTHQRIVALVGGPYLELFSRESVPGWESWGNDVNKFSAIDG